MEMVIQRKFNKKRDNLKYVWKEWYYDTFVLKK